MILWWNWETSKETLLYIKNNTNNVFHYLFNWDHPFCLIDKQIISKNIWDRCFVTGDCNLDDYINSGSKKSYYLRMFADEEIHFPEYDQKYECDVSFACTNLYENKNIFPGQLFDRKTFIQNIIDAGIDIKIYGPDDLKNIFPNNYGGFTRCMDNHKVFYNSKINICLHVVNDYKYCNERVGIVLSSGGLLFCDKVKGNEEILTDGVDCIFIDENNYVNQIKTILKNYDNFKHIKENAVKTAMKKFSPLYWSKFIDSKLQKSIKKEKSKDYSLKKCYTFSNYQPKKVSIIMTYSETMTQLINTLNTIQESKYPKEFIEVILYDDRSDNEPCIIDTSKYSYNIKIIYVEFERNENKINSTFSYNNAFKYISGEYVIIQNSECMHIGDIISYSVQNIKDNILISFPCWATANENISTEIFNNRYNTRILKNIIDTKWQLLNNYPSRFKGWYNEKFLRPECLNFCTAMHINTFKKIGVFDTKLETSQGFDEQRIMFDENIDIIIPEHNYNLFTVYQFRGKHNNPRPINVYRKINNDPENKCYVSNIKVVDINYYDITDKNQFINDLHDKYRIFTVNLYIHKYDNNLDIKFLRECLRKSNLRLNVLDK